MTQPDATQPETSRSGYQPVFILGPARAGTSLLYKTLCLHRNVSYISNWLARYPQRPQLGRLARLATLAPKARDRAWFGDSGNAYVYGARRPLRHRVFPAPVEGEPVFASCGITDSGTAPGIEPTTAALALRQRIDSIQRAAGGTHFVNKRIGNNRRVGILLEAFPQAAFLAIVRDGRAVAASLAGVDWWEDSVLWWDGRTPRQWKAAGLDPWLACARNWVEDLGAMEQGMALVPDANKHLIRYEDLVEDRTATLEKLASFIGLDDSRRWLDSVALQLVPSVSGWRDRLPSEAIAVIEAAQHNKLAQYGYDQYGDDVT